MKLDIAGTPTVSTGVNDEFEYAIANNAVAFEAYSSKLYTDKARAIIRELSCNAWDAHVAAGCADKPFEIHLPTNHEPYFSINDYGTGLSHDDMKALFALYFGSNKRGSNKFVGALGLGSKSPFAYDGNGGSYSIISRKDGKTRMYVASKKDGMPHMEQLGPEMETPDAPNGIEIKFAIATKDIWEWEKKAQVALECFQPSPVVNIPGFQPKRYEYALKGENWGLRKEAQTPFGYNTRAIMGNVQYQVGYLDDAQGVTAIQRKILEMPIDMFFPLGALDFAISREALEMKPRTVANILKMADKIYDELIDVVKKQINGCKHAWEASILLYSLINSTSSSAFGGASMGGLIKAAKDKGLLYGQYDNFVYTEQQTYIDELAYDHVTVIAFGHNSRADHRARKASKFLGAASQYGDLAAARVKAKTDSTVKKVYQHRIDVEPNVQFIVNDTKIPGDKYIHYFLQEDRTQQGKTTVYFITRNSKEVKPAAAVKEAKKLIADLGSPSYLLMSELVTKYPQLATVRGSGPKRLKRNIVVLKAHLHDKVRYTATGWTRAWRVPTDVEHQLAKKYYVVLDKLVATDTKFSDVWGMKEFFEHVRASGKFGLDADTPVFGVKRGDPVLTNNTGEFVELMSHVYSNVKKIMTPAKTAQLSLHLVPFTQDVKDLLTHIAKNKPLDADSPIQKFALELADANEHDERNWNSFKRVLDFCERRQKYTPGQVVNFNEKWNEVEPLYPMLSFVGSYNIRSQIPKLLDYVKLVDAANKAESLAAAATSNT